MSLDSVCSAAAGCEGVFPRRAHTIQDEAQSSQVYIVKVYMHCFHPESSNDRLSLEFHKRSTTEELIEKVIGLRDDLDGQAAEDYDIYEMMGTPEGQMYKERRLDRGEYPVAVQLIWSRLPKGDQTAPKHRFVFRHRGSRGAAGGTRFGSAEAASTIDAFLAKFLTQPVDREYADLCMLPELTEQTLLDNLRERFNSGHIYTYIGPILVAVNPFSFFPIYNPKYARLYCQSRRLGALPPHIFAIADITYHNMLRIKENQCVVISGESGSGKTESTNHLISHLTTLSQKGSGGASAEMTLLSAGPVLEAFGNAVTIQNNNSSRFGKFIKINYRENGMVSGANVEIYLLEKSRIISQAKGERNYHVFYYLLAGASEEDRQKYCLLKAEDYHYLNQNTPVSPEGVDEKYEFERLKQSMSDVGFSRQSQETIFGIISAVLLLGNVTYIKRHGYHSDENAYIENEEVVDLVAKLLKVRPELLQQALTMKRTVMKQETVVTRYSVSEATNTRDAMAKCLYNALFDYIVLRVNQALLKNYVTAKGYYIGILDIFGFEDLGAQWNSFEQLCINYANEHLQAYFNQHIFQFEQEEYFKEGISWTSIEYTDNTECVQLFQSKPYGILRLIDEESNINNGTDESMLAKLNQFLKANEYYETPQKREPAFIIAHYAGKVKYQITGFREKNKDLMRQDVLNTLKTSRSALMRSLLGSDPVAVHRWSVLRSVVRAMNGFKQSGKKLQRSESAGHLRVTESVIAPRRGSDSALSAFLRGELQLDLPDFCDTSMFNTIKSQARRTPAGKTEDKLTTLKSLQILKDTIGKKPIGKKPSSVSKQFEFSLSRLMKTLGQAKPYFIRCIKSNNDKIPNHFDDNIILRQLRYTGMLETVRIRRAGYSVRIEYERFIQQYRILLKNGRESTVEDVKNFISKHPAIESNNIQYGNSKVFMRDAEKLILDDHLHRTIMHHIDTLQRWFRTMIARRRYLKLKNGIVKIQALVRGALARNKLRREAYAALVIQTNWRSFIEQKKYQMLRNSVLAIQAAHRGKEARKRLGDIPRGKPTFRPQRVRPIQLGTFDLSNPDSLTQYANSEDELDTEDDTEDGLDEDVDDGSVLGDGREDDMLELDATFILEDTKLKLVEEGPDPGFHRRQSLAATASQTKLKMLRRANSTDSNQIIRTEDSFKELQQLAQDSHKKKSGSRLGFTKAKQNLKALFGRRAPNEEDEIVPGPSTANELSPESPKEHQLKMSRLHRQELCTLCNRYVTGLLSQAFKCGNCKLTFHKECKAFARAIPCRPASPLRSPTRPSSSPKRWEIMSGRARHSTSPLPAAPTFSLNKTKQQTDPGNMIVESTEDLRLFSVFIFKKQTGLQDASKRDTVVDAIFKKSMREFHMELIGHEAVLTEGGATLKYRDLISTFEGVLIKVCREEKVTFPIPLGLNAFRGFLNEFMQTQTKKKGQKQKTGIIRMHAGHRFKSELVHVPTYCEACNQFMWHAEKVWLNKDLILIHQILICVACRMSVHKKCHTKLTVPCSLLGLNPATPTGGRFFGIPLIQLIDEENTVPILLDKLFMAVETRALFVEGIYRKCGSIAHVRTARKNIETSPDEDVVGLDDLQVHVLTTLIKCFFREMPEPAITFDLYENFLNASEVEETAERIRCLSIMIDLLPKSNRALLDRLMFHLARVAHQESVNKMGASNLALIFGPCILRRHDAVHAQEQLADVSRQAVCVQTLIEEKLRQYKATLNNIVELENASHKVSVNLQRIEEHQQLEERSPNMGTAKILFEEQLDFLGKEKERLLQELPPLAPVASSEDLSTSEDLSQGYTNEEYAIDLDSPPVFGLLAHPTKTRPRPPKNRRQRVLFYTPRDCQKHSRFVSGYKQFAGTSCSLSPRIPMSTPCPQAPQPIIPKSMNEALKDAFTATVGRDYEKAVTVIRAAVATSPEPFGAEDLELMDHVYSCILNTSHYDETVMEVCWEWIDASERSPRIRDPRVVASSQLSIYYAYHTICRVQERIPRKTNHQQMRIETWKRCSDSFQYLWSAATQFWKPADLDRLDVLVSWSYLALQFADVCDEQTLNILDEAREHSSHVLSSTIIIENSHQSAQRVATVARNVRDARALAEKMGRSPDPPKEMSPDDDPPVKKARDDV